MTWRGEQFLGIGGLDDTAQVHHRDTVRDVFHHGEVVRNEDIGQPEPVLQIAQQVQDLRTDRDIQRRYRLVADDEFGLDCERPGDGDALALTAGEFVAVAACESWLQPDQAQQFLDALAAA